MDKKTEEIIELATKLGIVNPTKVRNLKICEKFYNYRNRDKIKYTPALEKLSKEYCLGVYQIESIIIKNGRHKNNKSTKAGN
jgi:hypothetical protein